MKGIGKTVFIAFAVMATWLNVNGQATQYGSTWEYKGAKDKTPLSGVNIIAGGATARSDQHGNFKLQFNNLKVGDRINVDIKTVATLKGYVLFNRDALEQWYVTKKSESFRIVLCRRKLFDKLVRKYYNISDSSYREQYRKECLRVEQLLREGEIQKAEYDRLLREAEIQHENDMKNAGANAELLARIDESDLEGDQLQIHQLLSEGKVDEAVRLINPEKSMETLEKITQKSNYIEEQRKMLDQKEREAREEREKQVAKMKFEMSVLMTEGGRRNLETCGQYWVKIIESDTTDLINLWNGASFFSKQHNYDLAEKYYKMAMRAYERLARMNPMAYAADYASVMNNLAIIYHERHEMQEAESYHLQAMSMLKYLVEKSDSATYFPVYASSLCNLANLYLDYGRSRDAERYLNEALQIRKRLADGNPDVYNAEYATTLSNAGALHHEMKSYDKALQYHAEALRIRRLVAENDTADANEDLATSLNNLANTYADLKRYDDAKGYYAQAIEIRRAMAAANPEAYNPDYATTLFNVALMYEHTRQLDSAERYHLQALEIRRVMAKSAPEAYKPCYAQSLNSVAILYSRMRRYQEAERYYLKGMECITNIAESNPVTYSPDCFTTLVNLSKLYDNGKGELLDSALVYYEQESAVLERLVERDSVMYLPYYASAMHTMGRIYGLKHAWARSEQCYLRAIELRRRLAEQDSLRYNRYYIMSLCGYAAMLHNQEKYDRARRAYEELLPVSRGMEDARVYCMVLDRLAAISAEDSLYVDAERYYGELAEAYKGMVERSPGVYDQRYVQALGNHAATLENLGYKWISMTQNDSAIGYLVKALEIRKSLSEMDSARFTVAYANSLHNIGALYNNMKRYEDAERCMVEAVTLRRGLYQQSPETYRDAYLQSLEGIINIYTNLKRMDMVKRYGDEKRLMIDD